MISQLRVDSAPQVCAPKPDERWNRNLQEDMIQAIDLLFKFKAGLDKLHPDCTMIIERMISFSPQRY